MVAESPMRVFERCLLCLEARHGHFTYQASFADLITLIGQLQLVLRHPANVGDSAVRTRTIVEAWIATLEASEPEIGPLLRLGFDPQHDVERKEPGKT